jgi:hypothetical protein
MVFLEGQDFDPTLIRRVFSLFSAMKSRGLNHSAILPSLHGLFQPQLQGDVTLVPSFPCGLFWDQDLTRFNPTQLNREYLSKLWP